MGLKNKETEELQEEEEKIEILKSFCQWLQPADGGRRDKKNGWQLRKILSMIDPEGFLSSLFDNSLIRDQFLTDHAEKKIQAKHNESSFFKYGELLLFFSTEDPECFQVDPAIVQKVAEKARLLPSFHRVKILRS